jgi:hypothetical protein
MKFDDELMGQLIRTVSSHEVGHTLGLRHNMGSSSKTPVEKLRDKKWVEANGHTVSIMDYARFNYVAQPEDNINKSGLFPRVGDYDKWAIQWGYTYTGQSDVNEDKKENNKWIIDNLKNNPRVWFGGEGFGADPRAQMEDLGDNAVLASEYGIKNLKRIIVKLPEWTKEEADKYENLKDIYMQLLGQFNLYMNGTAPNYLAGALGVGIAPSATAGRIDASNDVVAFSTSDIRFKENINPIDNALEKLDQIGGYTFDWKTDKELVSLHGYEGHDIGVIAQEIESVLPEVVTTRDNGYKAVKYEKIVPFLIQCIKELKDEIRDLKSQK